MEAKRFLTELEAAQYLNVSRAYLAKSRSIGTRPGHTPAPPWHKFTGKIRYAVAARPNTTFAPIR